MFVSTIRRKCPTLALVALVALPVALPVVPDDAMAGPRRTARPLRPAISGEIAREMREHGRARVIVTHRGANRTGVLSRYERRTLRRARQRMRRALRRESHRVVRDLGDLPFTALEVSAPALERALATGDVSGVTLDLLHEPHLDLSVPRIGAPALLPLSVGGTGWAIAVLDTGVDGNHPFLAGKVVDEACFSDGSCPDGSDQQLGAGSGVPCEYADNCSHGTHVAGIAAWSGSQFSGVALDSEVVSIQVFSEFSPSYCNSSSPCALSWTSDLAAAVYHVTGLAATRPIAALNMSLGGGSYSSQTACNVAMPPLTAAIAAARAMGVATTVSAGNGGESSALAHPGCISNAVSVGSTDDLDRVSWFSNSAPFLSLLAPGQYINSSVPGGGYASWAGTSMAAPHVAGAFALLRHADPEASVGELLMRLRDTGEPVLDEQNQITFQRIQIDAALSCDDEDSDGFCDTVDACPLVANPGDPDGCDCLCGDVNGDCIVSAQDALAVQRNFARAASDEDPGFARDHCDVTGEGICNPADALAIQGAIGSPGSLPASCPAATGAAL